LACFPDPNDRPKGFLTPPLFAGKVGRELVAKADKLAPDHPEMWEATANGMRASLKSWLSELPSADKAKWVLTGGRGNQEGITESFVLDVEDGLKLTGFMIYPPPDRDGRYEGLSRKVVVLSEGWVGENEGYLGSRRIK